MSDQTVRTPFFSIKWQAFSVMSLVLTGLVVLFLVYFFSANVAQFETERSSIYKQNKQQLDSLITTSADNMIQLGNAATLSAEFTAAVYEQDTHRLNNELEQLSWNFQLDAGIDNVSVYNQFGRLLSSAGAEFSSTLIEQVLVSESAQWNVECLSVCAIQAGMPLLHQGQVMGAIVLSQPLSNVMLKFQEVANINTGLLSTQTTSEEFNQFIPSWGQNLVALTNPQANASVINSASELFSLEELHTGGQLVDVNNQVYELRAMTLEGREMLVISDVSTDISTMQQYKSDIIRTSLLALVLAEVLLLVFLWRPLSRFKQSAGILPLLADKQYDDARNSFESSDHHGLFKDESDLFKKNAAVLADELETLQSNLDFHEKALAQKTKALDHAETFSNTLLDNMDAAVMILDENTNVVSSNKYLIRLLGISSKSLHGKPFKELSEAVGGNKWLDERLQDVLDGVLSEFQHESLIDSQFGTSELLNWRHVPMYDGFTGSRQILSVAMPIRALAD